MQISVARPVEPDPAPPFVYARDNWLHPLLVCLLYLTMALTFVAAGWTEEGAGVFMGVVAGAVGCGLLVTYARFSAMLMLGFGLLAGLCWTVLLVAGQVPEEGIRGLLLQGFNPLQSRAYLLLGLWGNWAREVVTQGFSGNNLSFLLNLSFYLWWIAYFGTWTLLRFGLSWRSLIMAGVVTGVNTYYAPEPVNGLFIFFLFVGLLVLISAHLISLQWRWRDIRIRFSADILFDFMQSGLLFSVLVVGGAWSIPRLGLSPTLNDVLTPISRVWEDTTDRIAAWNQGVNQQQRAGEASFNATLTLGGARVSSDQPVMRVAAAEGRYWRANVYDVFDGRQWENSGQARSSLRAESTVPVPAWDKRTRRVQQITPLRDLGFVVLAAPDIVQMTVPAVARYDVVSDPIFTDLRLPPESGDAAPVDTWELQYVLSQTPLLPDVPYQVLSSLTTATIWDMENASAEIPEDIRARYLQVPASVDPAVAQLATTLTAGAKTQYAKAKALETALRRIPYAEDIKGAPPGTDPVGYFLFELQRGYCDYYATSMVVMLRLLDIPARLATGYAEGEFQPETQDFLVKQEDAHTWVEVYFAGLGWIEFEPTAGESVLIRAAGGPPAAPDPDNAGGTNALPDNLQDLLDQGRDPEDPFSESSILDAFDPAAVPPAASTDWRIWIAGVLVAIALIGGGWRWRRWHLTRHPLEDAVGRIYDRLMRWGVRLQLPFQACDTPLERGQALAQAWPQLAAEFDAICLSYVRLQYGTRVPRSGQMQAQIQTERAWRQIQGVFWRRWLRLSLGQLFRGRR